MKGTVWKDKRTNTYDFAVEAGADPATGKRRRVHRGGFTTEKEAENALGAILHEAQIGAYKEPSKQPLRVYLEKWLTGMDATKKASTAVAYRAKLRRYVIPRLGAMPLSDVDIDMLETLYAELALSGGRISKKTGKPSPIAAATIGVVHRILHHVFKDAVRRRLIPFNPATDAIKPREIKKERQAWDRDELRKFFEHITDDRLRALWVLIATTGIRRGEAAAAKWSDLQLPPQGNGQLVVQRNRVPVPGKGIVEDTPKSDRVRSVALPPSAVQALRVHRKRQTEERLAWDEAKAPWPKTDYVFTRENGEPLNPDHDITAGFNDRVAAAGLRPIVQHGLRHSHATVGLASGVPVKVMQERLGHAKVETTLAYTHSLPGMQERAAERFEELLFRPDEEISAREWHGKTAD